MQGEVIPEKKGLFLKEVEYEASRQPFKASGYRPQEDFAVFRDAAAEAPLPRGAGPGGQRRALRCFTERVAWPPCSPRLWPSGCSRPSVALLCRAS